MGIEAVSHGWDCRCARCERDAAWQAYAEPDWRLEDEERRDRENTEPPTTAQVGRTI